MQHWEWWLSGAALAGVPLLNWLVVRRLMAVSGRYTALVDRVRLGPAEQVDMSPEELMAAVREATASAFGDDALELPPEMTADDRGVPEETAAPPKPARTPLTHAVFLASLIIGGFISAALAGSFELSATLRAAEFTDIFGSKPMTGPLVLVAGGVLVGFGTRMAAGCTSGHGLCGVSRVQPGSLLATVAFFGMGVVVSFALEMI